MGGAAFAYVVTQYLLWSKGDLQRSLEFEAPCLRAHALAPNLRVYMWSLTISGWALGDIGQFDRGLAKCEVAMSAGDGASDPSIVCECLWTMAIIFLGRGAVDSAVEYAQRAIDVGPTPADRAWAQVTLGWALSRSSPETSIRLLEPMEPVFRAAGQIVTLVWLGVALGESYWRAGRLKDALRTLCDTVKLSQWSRAKHWEGKAHRLIGEIGLEQATADSLESAGDHFRTALSLFEMCGAEPDIARANAGLGQVMQRQGKADEADRHVTRAQEITERLGMLD
jgi:tetratricopeptide (TPR) repeat protein